MSDDKLLIEQLLNRIVFATERICALKHKQADLEARLRDAITARDTISEEYDRFRQLVAEALKAKGWAQ